MNSLDSKLKQFSSSLSKASKKIHAVSFVSQPDSQNAVLSDVRTDLEKAQQIINDIRAIAVTDENHTQEYLAIVKQKEQELNEVKSHINSFYTQQSQPEHLSVNLPFNHSASERNEKNIGVEIDASHARLLAVQENLEYINSLANESHDIGANTLESLQMQRERLLNANQGLDRIESHTTQSTSALHLMKRRVMTKKIILFFIIFLLIFANIMVIVVRWIIPLFKKK